ncbi:MAG: hypothetical protein AAF387_17610, partial [Pseudomonadota bacterium]
MNSFSAPQYALIDKVGMPHVMAFIVKRLSLYNTDDLDWLKLLPLQKKNLLHGECMFPYFDQDGRKEHGFRIRASVNINMVPPFEYEHWARIPSKTARQGWTSGEQIFHFADLEECAVHTLAHECFHFLSETNQIDEKNTEANANWWADGWLASFRLNQQKSFIQLSEQIEFSFNSPVILAELEVRRDMDFMIERISGSVVVNISIPATENGGIYDPLYLNL